MEEEETKNRRQIKEDEYFERLILMCDKCCKDMDLTTFLLKTSVEKINNLNAWETNVMSGDNEVNVMSEASDNEANE